MGRDKSERAFKKSSGRDGGSFVALPWSVLDCSSYRLLSYPAKSLLFEFARQYVRDNNGRLLATGKYLAKRGWKSADVIHRAKNELLAAGFIYETVKGCRPNKASWYAITWQNLDKHHGYDAGAFVGWREARSGYTKPINLRVKNTMPIPSTGVDMTLIVPCNGATLPSPTTPNGTINTYNSQVLAPSDGNHLDIPSAVT